MNHTDYFADILGHSIFLRVDSELFIWLAGDVPARVILLLAANAQQQPAALFRVLGCRMSLYRAQNVFVHGQLRAIKLTAGKPPKLSSLPAPNRHSQPVVSSPLH